MGINLPTQYINAQSLNRWAIVDGWKYHYLKSSSQPCRQSPN